MRRARSWLDKHGFKIRQVADWMYKSCWIFAVLCEAARNVTAKRCHVLAQQWFRRMQWKHVKQGCMGSAATRSPIDTLVTFLPTAAMVPAASCPGDAE
jgi:hypothetical protein